MLGTASLEPLWHDKAVPLIVIAHKRHLMWVVDGVAHAVIVNEPYALRAYGVRWFSQLASWLEAYDKDGSFLLLCDCGGYGGWAHHASRLGVRRFCAYDGVREEEAETIRAVVHSYGGMMLTLGRDRTCYHFRDGVDDGVREDFMVWCEGEGLGVKEKG